jgi:hypothetical protein
VINAGTYLWNDQTSNSEPKALMMKAGSNQRAANRGDQLVRALMCGPAQKSVHLSEPSNFPGSQLKLSQ